LPGAKAEREDGIGMFGEQYVATHIGVFSRAMFSDGKTEVDVYTSMDPSVSLESWLNALFGRAHLMLRACGWISPQHAEYLRRRGIDGFQSGAN
jgi:hypothetical protein